MRNAWSFFLSSSSKSLLFQLFFVKKALCFSLFLCVATTSGHCTGRAEGELAKERERERLGTSSDCFVYDDSYAQTSAGGGYDLTLCHKTTVHYVCGMLLVQGTIHLNSIDPKITRREIHCTYIQNLSCISFQGTGCILFCLCLGSIFDRRRHQSPLSLVGENPPCKKNLCASIATKKFKQQQRRQFQTKPSSTKSHSTAA